MMRYLSFVVVLLFGCTGASDRADMSLENTLWTLMELGDAPITVGAERRPPTLTLRGEDKRMSGFTGCNQMAGSYTLNGATLRFGQMITTKMACLDSGMETEGAFTAALQRVQTWSVSANRLTLSDAAGVPLATFEAREAR